MLEVWEIPILFIKKKSTITSDYNIHSGANSAAKLKQASHLLSGLCIFYNNINC